MKSNKVIQTPKQSPYSGAIAGQRVNVAAATTLLGGTYAVDLDTADALSTTQDLGDTNVDDVTTLKIAAGQIVIAADTIAVGSQGPFIEGEAVRCKALVDGTTDVTKGDPLKCTNAGTNFVKATAGTDKYHAIALETRTANSVGLMEVLLYSSGRR